MKLLKQLIMNVAPSRGIYGRTAPTAADVPTLLGIGPFSLLGVGGTSLSLSFIPLSCMYECDCISGRLRLCCVLLLK